MSTKTSFKRIALVAASALAIAGFSAVPAHAATTPAFTGAAVGTAAGSTGTVTAVVAALGSVTRTAPRTWTTPLTLTVTGTTVGATDEFTVAGTVAATTGTATSALSALAKDSTTTTGAVLSGLVTFTTVADTIASALVALDTYTMTFTVVDTGAGAAVAAAAVTATLAGATGTLIAPTAGSGSTASAILQQVNGQATAKFVSGASDTSYTVTSTGVGSVLSTSPAGGTATAAVNLNGTNAAGGVSWTPVTTIQTLSLIATSAVAGTQTLTFQPIGANGIPGTAIKAVITWGAAPTDSAQFSLVKLLAGTVATNVTTATVDTTLTSVSKAAGTQRFTIEVEVNDSNGTAIPAGSTLAASISGPGLIGIADSRTVTTATGRSLSQLLTAEFGAVSVFGDGSAGVSVITITVTTAGVTTTLGTKTVTFLGSPVSAKVTQNLKVAKAGTQLGATPTTTIGANLAVATTEAFTATVLDSAGLAVVAGSTVKMTSSDTTVITVGACAEFTVDGDATATTTPKPGVFGCSVSGAGSAISGKTATVTFSVLNATTGLFDIVATPITFSIGGSIATVSVALDAASYATGQAMALTATAKDSSGNAVFDGQDPYHTDASANKTVAGLDTTGSETIGGVSTLDTVLFAPATTGDFTISGKGANTAGTGSAFAITATVEKDQDASLALDAANAATDAANNAYDEAQNATQAASDALAAVTALAAQVKSLIASVKKLTAAVAKLKK